MATLPDASQDIVFIYPYESPTPGSITVVAYGMEREDGDIFTWDKVFKDVVACNFNLVCLKGKDEPAYKKTLANTQDKIGVMATNNLLQPPHYNADQEKALQEAKNFYDTFKNFIPKDENGNPLRFQPIKAWALKDEPVYQELAYKHDGYNLRTIYNYIRSGELARKNADRTKSLRPIQVNLVGAGEPKFMHGIILDMSTPNEETNRELKYQVYLDTFRNNYQPSLWSYDMYPISRPVADSSVLNVNYNRFYKDLVTFNRRAQETSGVFWAYAQSMEFITSSGNTLYPAPTVPYLRFEIFSALAFGAQGIVYWTYRLRIDDSSSETYLSALVDRDFNRTPAWSAAMKVNGEVKAYSEVFVGTKLLDFTHVGKADTGYPVLEGDFGPIKHISATKTSGISGSTGEEGLGVLITRINTKGSEFIIIVSHDVENPQQIAISFSPDAVISSTKINIFGKIEYVRMTNNMSHLLTLEPGGYLIFRHDNA